MRFTKPGEILGQQCKFSDINKKKKKKTINYFTVKDVRGGANGKAKTVLLQCERRGFGKIRGSLRSVNVRVFLGPVHRAEPLHVLFDVLLGLVLHILVALEVLGVLASFQLLVHDSVR